MPYIAIRTKVFAIIITILLFFLILFTVTTKLLLKPIIIGNLERDYEGFFLEMEEAGAGGSDWKTLVRGMERVFGGFITLADGNLNIIYSSSPGIGEFRTIPGNYHPFFRQLAQGESSYLFFFQSRDRPRDLPEGIPPPPLDKRPLYERLFRIHADSMILIGTLPVDTYIIIEKPIDTIMEGVEYALQGMFVTLLIILILGLVIGVFFSYGITKPIFEIKKKAEAVASLDFDHELNLKNRDEIGDLGETMNAIAGEMKSTLHRLAEEHRELEVANGKLRELSRTDELTRLANRTRINEFLDKEFYRADRRGGIFSVIILDIDHFKGINDRFGHLAGDGALREIAQILSASSRQSDLAGRWGGEEFMLILPDTDGEGARCRAETLRGEVEARDFEDIGSMTVSMGIAEFRRGHSLNDLLAEADRALYRAKEGGRNRVEMDSSTGRDPSGTPGA